MYPKLKSSLAPLIAAGVILAGEAAQATVVLDLEDKVIDTSLVSFPYTFTYSMVQTSTSPDTGKLLNSFDSRVSFSPTPSGIELLGVSSSLAGFAGGSTVNPVPGPGTALPGQVVVISSLPNSPALPAGPSNILTYTLRINSAPAPGTTYATSIVAVQLKEATSGTPTILTSNVGGSISFIASAVPEPLTAAGIMLLSTRVLGRRVRASL